MARIGGGMRFVPLQRCERQCAFEWSNVFLMQKSIDCYDRYF